MHGLIPWEAQKPVIVRPLCSCSHISENQYSCLDIFLFCTRKTIDAHRRRKDVLRRADTLLKQFWDFENNTYLWNSGIKKALTDSRYFDEMYQKHLENRKGIFEKFIAQLKGFETNNRLLNLFIDQQHIWTIFYRRLYVIDKTEEQKNRLLAKPFVFPRGIFDPKPTYIKGVSVTESPELYADWYQYSYQTHQYQRFYDFERDYEDIYERKEINDRVNKYNLSPEQQFLLFKQKQDKKIKEVRTQDLFLKLVTEDIFEKLFGYKHPLSLKDFYLTQKERLEKEKTAVEQSQRSKGDSSENIIKDNFLWSKTVSFIKGQINEPAVKIKDIGKFKRFLDDVRVQRIFSYDTDRKWTKLELVTGVASTAYFL